MIVAGPLRHFDTSVATATSTSSTTGRFAFRQPQTTYTVLGRQVQVLLQLQQGVGAAIAGAILVSEPFVGCIMERSVQHRFSFQRFGMPHLSQQASLFSTTEKTVVQLLEPMTAADARMASIPSTAAIFAARTKGAASYMASSYMRHALNSLRARALAFSKIDDNHHTQHQHRNHPRASTAKPSSSSSSSSTPLSSTSSASAESQASRPRHVARPRMLLLRNLPKGDENAPSVPQPLDLELLNVVGAYLTMYTMDFTRGSKD